jgi:glycerate-2-kinase
MKSLIAAGATIHEINTIRKHLSYARGGYLAKDAYPARVVSLIFSDVVGDELTSIASGPTVKDETTVEDAIGVLTKFQVLDGRDVRNLGLIDTPKDDKYFENVSNNLVLSNTHALIAMKEAAEKLGFHAEIGSNMVVGEAEEVGKMIAENIHAAASHTVLLWGGETTVTVRGTGRGGRNLELCASALRFVQDGEEILSFASDGRDHGAFAGAVCDTITTRAAIMAGADMEAFRATNDLYPFFEKIGQYLMTGDTGSNVSDLIIALKM